MNLELRGQISDFMRKRGISLENIHLLLEGNMTLEDVLTETMQSLKEQQMLFIDICKDYLM